MPAAVEGVEEEEAEVAEQEVSKLVPSWVEKSSTRIMIYKGMFYKSKYSIWAKK